MVHDLETMRKLNEEATKAQSKPDNFQVASEAADNLIGHFGLSLEDRLDVINLIQQTLDRNS